MGLLDELMQTPAARGLLGLLASGASEEEIAQQLAGTERLKQRLATTPSVVAAKEAFLAPQKAYSGELQMVDPMTGRTSDAAVEAATGLAGTAMTGGLGGLGGKALAKGETALGAGPIRAYHGSPHDFDRFDLSKIGTGEGNQAYGHGLYFAENQGVAETYKGLQGRASQDPAANVASKVLAARGGDESSTRDHLRLIFPKITDAEIEVAIKTAKNPPSGRMYEVAIHADPERFLDWDKPLIEQGATADAFVKSVPTARNAREAAYRDLFDNKSLQHMLRYYADDQPATSTALKDAGIPGIKYLDAGSRGSADGSRNYVVFDDKLVEILKKYGVASFAALPPAVQAAFMAQQDKGQQ